MIVLGTQEFLDDTKTYISLELMTGSLCITYTDQNNNVLLNKTVSVSEYFKPFSDKVVFLNRAKTEISNPTNIPVSRDKSLLFMEVNNLDIPLLSIHFGANIEDLLVICRVPTDNQCLQVKFDNFYDLVCQNIPQYKKHRDRVVGKRKILSMLDCNESLSGLEAQLDYLTFIVQCIANGNIDIKNKLISDCPNVDKFFEICTSDNIIAIKPEDKLFDEVDKQKKTVRSAQTEYYNEVNK